jgi:hypothetical protein
MLDSNQCSLSSIVLPSSTTIQETIQKPEIFKDQDEQLQNQIDQVNTFIQQYNTTVRARSPLLNHHLKARKQVRTGKGKPHKNYVPLILLVLCLDKVSV